MATSRLANKVRTKIKQNKKSDEAAAAAAAAQIVAVESVPLPSDCEVGSVKHYKVLIAANVDGKVVES